MATICNTSILVSVTAGPTPQPPLPRQNRHHLEPSRAWQQVAERDATADFFYGVSTTGVFCRPDCPSRRPAPVNVVYFRSADAALAAGYRACLRCRPASAPADSATVSTLCAHLQANLDRKVTLAELARVSKASPFTVQRTMRRVLGISPSQYQRQLRAQALRTALTTRIRPSRAPITEAIYDAGYSSASMAYEDSPLGMTPGEYRAGAAGETIHFTTAPCPLGFVLVAATTRGICSVTLGDDPQVLEAQLRGYFPAASISRAALDSTGTSMGGAMPHILSQMTEHSTTLTLPLDVRATAFQARVWQALRAIPRGETRTYSAIATSLGQPRAVRAVARACASNPVGLLVPCHRVIASDGKLAGYRWGLDRKRKLLELERPKTTPPLQTR